MKWPTLSLLALALALPLAAAEEKACCPAPPPPPTDITVRGEAMLEIPPDEAVLEFSLAWEAPELAEARRAHNEQSAKVIALLKAADAKDDEIRSSLSITRQVKIEGKFRTRSVTSHHVQSDYVVTLHHLDKLDGLLDGLIAAGVDHFTGVHFRIRLPEERLKALRLEALADARAQAEGTAKQLGVRLGRIIGLSGPSGASRGGNPAVSGASGMENQYLIGGVNTGNSGYGAIGAYDGQRGFSATFDFSPTQVKDSSSSLAPVEGEESVFSRPGTLKMKVEVFVSYELDDLGRLNRPAPETPSPAPVAPAPKPAARGR